MSRSTSRTDFAVQGKKEVPHSSASNRATTLSNMFFKSGPASGSGSSVVPTTSKSTSSGGGNILVSSPTMTTTSILPTSISAGSSSSPTSPASKSFSPLSISPPTSPQHRKSGSYSRFPSFSNPFIGVPETKVVDGPTELSTSPNGRSPPSSPRLHNIPPIRRNVSFVLASEMVTSPESESTHTTPLNGTLPLPTGTRPRSRRSSTALAVSVSLASRSRSRSSTPNLNPRSPPMPQHSGGEKTNGTPNQFEDFAWDEAFDDDDEGYMVRADDDLPNRTSASARSSRRGRTSTQRSMDTLHMDGFDEEHDHLENGDMADIFSSGYVFGAGHSFQGEVIEAVAPRRLGANGEELPVPPKAMGHHRRASLERCEVASKSFQVVRQLGSGSFAVVYLVKEIGGVGQEYALKCLSKKDLDQDQLDSQMFEATIHLSLPRHQNVVTLHQALQTKKWLFLLMEMCPGEDLFFWLEHSRDSPPTTSSQPSEDAHAHARDAPLSSSALPSSAVPFSSGSVLAGMGTLSISPAFSFSPLANFHHANGHGHGHHTHHTHNHNHSSPQTSHTPTTPSLLAAYSASALLSNRRLRLIASMFVQMCEAVALCHDVGVSHRDIKPENFICCDSQELSALPHDGEAGFYDKRKVVVKLTDFGLATSEERNTDVECGSRPYMAFECRNNLGPDYAPGPADIWSLGIVLINMLFHRQPWADPVQGDANFDDFLASPTEFLLNKFTGIGREVATYLAERIFCLHVDRRVDAREFGAWAKDLPSMIGGRKAVSALKASRLNDHSDGREPLRFTKTAFPPRDNQSQLTSSTLTKSAPTPPMSQEPSAREATQPMEEEQVTPPAQTEVADDETVQASTPRSPEQEDADDREGSIRSASVGKRKKRGTRKGKAAQAAASAILAGLPSPPPGERDVLLAELAEASQSLAREMSKTVTQKEPEIDMFEFPRLGEEPPVRTSKTTKLNSFLKSKNPELQALARKVQEREGSRGNYSAPAQLQHGNSATSSMAPGTSSMTSSGSPQGQTKSHNGPSGQQRIMAVDNWRRPADATTSLPSEASRGRDWRHGDSARDERSPLCGGGSRPASTFTGSSIYSGQSSNDSTFTFSTTATTMSSISSKSSADRPRTNVKHPVGIPWELNAPNLVPRQHRMEKDRMPEGDVFSKAHARKTKTSGTKPVALPSISERPGLVGPSASAPLPPSVQDSTPSSSGFSAVTITKTETSSSNHSSTTGTARPGSPPTSSTPPNTKIKSGISSFGKMFGIKSNKHRD